MNLGKYYKFENFYKNLNMIVKLKKAIKQKKIKAKAKKGATKAQKTEMINI